MGSSTIANGGLKNKAACGQQMRLRHSSRDIRRQSKRHGEAVGHTDHNVFDGISPPETVFRDDRPVT
jgi:hypothetical protein